MLQRMKHKHQQRMVFNDCVVNVLDHQVVHDILFLSEQLVVYLMKSITCYCPSAVATVVEQDSEDSTFVLVDQRWGIDHEVVNQRTIGKTESRET